MDPHYKNARRYNTEQQKLLKMVSTNYIYSATLDDLEANRQQLLDLLQPQDYDYTTRVWKMREKRSILCHTKERANPGQYATSESEGLNAKVHRHTHHQIPLEQAAEKLIGFVEDPYRGFDEERDRTRAHRAIGIDKHVFQALQETVTLQAIKYINQQWQRVVKFSCARTTEMK